MPQWEIMAQAYAQVFSLDNQVDRSIHSRKWEVLKDGQVWGQDSDGFKL